MAEEVHLGKSLFLGHRLGLEALDPDDFAQHVLVVFAEVGAGIGGVGHGSSGLAGADGVVAVVQALLVTAGLAGEGLSGEVKGDAGVGGALFGAEDGGAAVDGDLDGEAVGGGAGLLVGDLDDDVVEPGEPAFEAGEPFGRVRLEVVQERGVVGADGEVHTAIVGRGATFWK